MRRCVLLLCCSLPLALHAEVFWAEATRVADGDTLWVVPVGKHTPKKLRLLGLDAPEICQNGGVASRAALQQLVAHKRLQIQVNFQDSYGRGLARIRVQDQDLGALMVQSGQAWSSRWHRSLGPYAKEEAQAKRAKLGLFGDPAAEWPGDFRKHFGSCYPTRQGQMPLR